MCKLRVKRWLSYSVTGEPVTGSMDNYDVNELLVEIREQDESGIALSLSAAYDLYIHTTCDMILEEDGRSAARFANLGFISAIQKLGFRVVLNGNEFITEAEA